MALQAEDKKATPVAIRYLSYRDRSCKEVTAHLTKKGFSETAVQKTVSYLTRLGYLDDERLALSWGRLRIDAKKIGARRLRSELVARGLSKEIVEQALATLFSEVDEWQLALSSARKKLSTMKDVDYEKKRRRLIQFLQRKGFAGDTVMQAVRELAPFPSQPQLK